MSNDKFAALLRAQGVIPPTKISPTTEKKRMRSPRPTKVLRS